MSKLSFEELKKIYEQGVNLDKISYSNEGLIFLKVRSLTKKNLKELCIKKGLIDSDKVTKEWDMRELIFNEETIEGLNNYILKHKEEITKIANKSELIESIKEVESHAPSVFMDNFDTVLRRVVRDKTITKIIVLKEKIENKLIPILRSYVEWSWFNQNTNDLIEDIFNNHQKIIPTLRKVKGVDFFVKLNNLEYPVDLKLTFLPKELISIYSKKGINTDKIIELVKDKPSLLTNWLYENQNPRLFNNNIRFFIVLIKKDNIQNSWKLKAEYKLIEKEVNNFLNQLNEKNIINVEYSYKKDDKVAGEYKTKCFLLIIEQ